MLLGAISGTTAFSHFDAKIIDPIACGFYAMLISALAMSLLGRIVGRIKYQEMSTQMTTKMAWKQHWKSYLVIIVLLIG